MDKFTVIFAKTMVCLLMVSSSIYVLFWKEIACYSEQKSALENVSLQFFDHKSVEFKNVSFEDDVVMCGDVNGKNRLGAYVGFSRFYVIGYKHKKKPYVTVEGNEDFHEQLFVKNCKKYINNLRN